MFCLLNFAADFLRFKVQLSSSAGQALRRVSALWHVRAGELAEEEARIAAQSAYVHSSSTAE